MSAARPVVDGDPVAHFRERFLGLKQAIGQIGRAVYQYDAGEKITIPKVVRRKNLKSAPAKARPAKSAGRRRG